MEQPSAGERGRHRTSALSEPRAGVAEPGAQRLQRSAQPGSGRLASHERDANGGYDSRSLNVASVTRVYCHCRLSVYPGLLPVTNQYPRLPHANSIVDDRVLAASWKGAHNQNSLLLRATSILSRCVTPVSSYPAIPCVPIEDTVVRHEPGFHPLFTIYFSYQEGNFQNSPRQLTDTTHPSPGCFFPVVLNNKKTTEKTLDLSYNGLTPAAAIVIASACKANTSLSRYVRLHTLLIS